MFCAEQGQQCLGPGAQLIRVRDPIGSPCRQPADIGVTRDNHCGRGRLAEIRVQPREHLRCFRAEIAAGRTRRGDEDARGLTAERVSCRRDLGDVESASEAWDRALDGVEVVEDVEHVLDAVARAVVGEGRPPPDRWCENRDGSAG